MKSAIIIEVLENFTKDFHIQGLKFFFNFSCGPFLKSFLICCNVASILLFGFLTERYEESQLPDQRLNPHSLHWRVES